MTRQEMIKKLEEIKEEVDWDSNGELTDYARERAYVCIQQAIEFLSEKRNMKMTKQEQINEMLLYVPQTIVAYDGNPKGQHLYGEQRQQIAKALYDAGYRKVEGLEKGNADLLKACEEQFTFDTTENKKYSIFDSVRKVFANEVKAKIDELLEEYEND